MCTTPSSGLDLIPLTYEEQVRELTLNSILWHCPDTGNSTLSVMRIVGYQEQSCVMVLEAGTGMVSEVK